MARLFRWFVLALVMHVGGAHALVPMTASHYEWGWVSMPDNAVQGYDASPQVACQNGWAAQVAYYGGRLTTPGPTAVLSGGTAGAVPPNPESYYCNGTLDGVFRNVYIPPRRTVAAACPANSTSVSGGCQCAAGYQEDSTHTQCVPQKSELEQFCQDHATAKNTFKMSGTVAMSAGLPTSSCYVPDPPFEGADVGKGCAASLGGTVGAPAGDGTLNWSGTGSFDGSTCSVAPGEPTPPSKDDPCPGGFEGTVNGVTRCVPAEPDKGIEGVKQSSSTDANGTKQDVKETTKCDGTKCTTTTTTTTTTASGSVSTSSTSSTMSIEDKCKADPTNPICQKTQGGKGSAVSQSTCQENSSAEGCGGEGAGIGELYTKKDKTVQQVLNKAKDDLSASPLGTSVGGFFNVSAGGSCPTVSGNIPLLNATFTFDAFCTSLAATMFAVLRGVLLMLAAWMAFRVAIDN